MLNNPIHLFRKDGLSFSNLLFTAKVFRRSTETTRLLNQGLAYRHLYRNAEIDAIPFQAVYTKQFFVHHWLVFRPEDNAPPPIRSKVLAPHSRVSSVIRSQIRRAIDYEIHELLQHYCTPSIDILIYPHEPVFFASPKVIQSQILHFLNEANLLVGDKQGASYEKEIDLVRDSYEDYAQFYTDIEKIQTDLEKQGSVLAVRPP